MQLFSKEAFQFKDQLRNMKKVQTICLCGLFAALYVVLSFLNIKMTPFLEFRFAFLALVAAAAYGGPFMGMTVGIAGDVISYFAAPQNGPFFPGFTLTYALMGFFFGLVVYRSKMTVIRAFLTSMVDFLLSISLTSFWLHLMYGMDWKYLFTLRLAKCSVSLIVNTALIFIFMKAFQKVLAGANLTGSARSEHAK